jgi:hypothetical protein
MGDIIDKVLYISIILYICLITIVLMIKPSFVYDDEKGKFKSFGFMKDESVVPIQLLNVLLCVFSYLCVLVYIFISTRLS